MSLSFQSLKISQEQLQVISELGFTQMTPVQSIALPKLLEGRDVRVKAQTGSGKTLAYAIPLLEKLNKEDLSLQAFILCPTRELCTQVAREIRKIGRHIKGLTVLVVSGGQPIYLQKNALEKGVHIVVGTPGRVIDHLSRRTIDLRSVQTIILDEADRMLDMGFQEDIYFILNKCPKKRSSWFFSATYPDSINEMSLEFQEEPLAIEIESMELEKNTQAITQTVFEINSDQREAALLWILKSKAPQSVIIFCNLKVVVDEAAQALRECGISAEALHGDLKQADRDRVMAKFRNKSIRVLVASDVASRGLDVDHVELVINYDLPKEPEVYVHRIGRTGRAGKTGEAIVLAEKREFHKINEIKKKYHFDIKEEKLPAFLEEEDLEQIHLPAQMQTLYITGGRKDKMRPGDILGALTGDAGGLDSKEIGKIEIFDYFSYVAISKDHAEIALKSLQKGKIKGKKFKVGFVD